MPFTTEHRDVGRPRVFSDAAIFAATNHVISNQGHSEFTLESIAQEVGCTRQALLRRFGSKQGLLLAYLETSQLAAAENYRIDVTAYASPLAALRARFVADHVDRIEIEEDPVTQARILAFMLTASSDPKVSPHFEAIHRIYLTEIERVLSVAIAQGELRDVDPGMLAGALYAASLGETALWASTPTTLPHLARLGMIFDVIITPYRTAVGGQ